MSLEEIQAEVSGMSGNGMSYYGGSTMESILGQRSYDQHLAILSGEKKITAITRKNGIVTISLA